MKQHPALPLPLHSILLLCVSAVNPNIKKEAALEATKDF